MPDITMCNDALCPMSNTCYRHRNSGTEPSEYIQSFFIESPREPDSNECDYYWNRKGK